MSAGHPKPTLELHLFGGLQISLNRKPMGGEIAGKARCLLAYLAVESERSHRRESLAELFWPERPHGTARRNLRQALLGLRSALGDQQNDPPFLISTNDSLQINPGSDCSVDTLEFDRYLRAADRHEHQGLVDCDWCEDQLGRAVQCYQGHFLIDAALPDLPEFESWVVSRREAYRRRLGRILGTLISMHEARRDFLGAAVYARQLVELEPWDEASHRALIRTLALGGRRSAAMQQYQSCRRILAAEFHVEPGAATAELYEAIREERLTELEAMQPATQRRADPVPVAAKPGVAALARPLRRFTWPAAAAAGLLLTVGALRMVGAAGAGDRSEVMLPAEIPDARIIASSDGDFMWTQGFLPRARLSISIYGSQGRELDPLCAGGFGADERGYVDISLFQYGLDLVPGNSISVSDGRTEKTLVLEDVAVQEFDIETDTMSGRAPAGRPVYVVVASGLNPADQVSTEMVSDEQTGEWRVDFAAMGVDLIDDMLPHSFAQVFDQDGDATEAVPPGIPKPVRRLLGTGFCRLGSS